MIHSLIQYALLIFGLLAALALFVSLKREMRSSAVNNRRRMEEFARQWAQQNNEHAAAAPEPIYIPAAPRAGLNISKRVQAMRMLRRNQDVSHIAAALGVTRREVELLIRVQSLGSKAMNTAN